MPVIINGTTGISGVDGSAGTPSYQGTDTNTGIFYPAADTIAFAEGGTEVMRIDSSGNVGIGVTPSASAASGVLFMKNNGQITFAGGVSYIDTNAVFNNAADRYIATAPATRIAQINGEFIFSNASSGTAGNAISFSERMRVASTGALGFSGANYGTAGQVLTSNGSGAAPSWQAAGGGFPAGTVMLFAQTNAPTGWTKDTTNFNNSGLRVVTGTASTGGTVDFTTAFASQAVNGSISSTTATNQATTATNQATTATNQAITPSGSVSITSVSGSAGSTTLTTPQIPSHTHTYTGMNFNGAQPGGPAYSVQNGQPTLNTGSTGGNGGHTHPFSFSSGSGTFSGNAVTALQNSHNHTQDSHNHTQDAHSHTFTGTAINLAVKYVDVIRATKD